MGATVSLEGDWHFEREEPMGTIHIWQKLNDHITAELRVTDEQWNTIVNDLKWGPVETVAALEGESDGA